MRILLCVDGSPCSDVAIQALARLPLAPSTTVQLITVDPPIESPLLKTSPTAFDALVKQQRDAKLRQLDEYVESLKRQVPNVTVFGKLLEGNPKDAIIAEAEHWGADLIVVGSHGYGPIRRFFLGSVSLFVAHHAPCSVLIARCDSECVPASGVQAPT